MPKDKAIHTTLKNIGILTAQGKECFKDCVVFPAYDIDGVIKNLFGIHTKTNTPVFLEDRLTGLWNAGVLKTCSDIIITPDILEALKLQMAGQHNVMALQAQNELNKADIRDLTAYNVKLVVQSENSDEEKRIIEILNNAGMENRINQLPGQKKQGESSESLPGKTNGLQLDFTVTYDIRNYRIIGLEKGIRKLKATVRIDYAGKLHVDTIDFYSARARKTLTQDICRVFNDIPEVIETDISRLILECEQRLEQGETPEETDLSSMTDIERNKAEILGKSPDLIERILQDYDRIGLIGEDTNKLLGYIAMTSRKLTNPLSVMILSSSGAGKTALQDAITSFCPPEDLVKLTTLSGKALFYKSENSLKNKVLAIEEGDGAEDATYAIRNLISSGVLISESTIKDFNTGKLTTMENRVEGPISVFLTTTNPNTDPETMSRFFVTGIDESREQTRNILAYQRKHHMQDQENDNQVKEKTKSLHWNFQRLLQSVSIKNPLSENLTYADDRLQSRRDQPKYLMLIKTACFLRQMQKELKTDEQGSFIEVDTEDIRIANMLANEILGRSMDEISRPGRDLLIQLDELVNAKADESDNEYSRTDITFTRRDIREYTGWANTRVHRYIKELTDLEYVLTETGKNGSKYLYKLAFEDQGAWSVNDLLGLSTSLSKAS